FHGAAGPDPRLPRPQRRRQDHHHAHHHRLHAGDERHGPGGRLRRLRAVGRGAPAHRLPAGEPAPLQRHGGRPVPALRGQAQGDGPQRDRGRARARGPDRRARRGAKPAPRTPLQGVPPARRPGAGPHSRSAGTHPRRADDRPRPAPDHRDPEPHPNARHPADGGPLDAHPARGVAGVRQGGHHQRGTRRPRGSADEPHPHPVAGRGLHRGDLARHGRRRARRDRGRGGGGMRNVLTIAGREIRSYFASPVAYVLIAAYLALAGYFFYALITAFNTSLQIYSMMRNPEMLSRFNLNEMVIGPLLHNMAVLLIFIVPAITMRMFPEEKSSGTYELLLTSPVRWGEIVLGKFLGSLLLVLLMV